MRLEAFRPIAPKCCLKREHNIHEHAVFEFFNLVGTIISPPKVISEGGPWTRSLEPGVGKFKGGSPQLLQQGILHFTFLGGVLKEMFKKS